MVKYVLELVCSPKGEQFKVLKFILNYTTSHLHFQCAKYHMNVTLNYAWMQGIITENCGRWLKWSNCSYISSFTPLMSIKPHKLFLATLPASSDSSSSTDDSDTPISRHFLPWALDFMCLVRFPLRKGYSQLHRIQKSHLFVTRTQTQRNCDVARWDAFKKKYMPTFGFKGEVAVLTDVRTDVCMSANVLF